MSKEIPLTKGQVAIVDDEDYAALSNQCNRSKPSNNSSGYKGVRYFPPLDKWQAQICFNRSRQHIGYFASKVDAAQAYLNTAFLLHGEFLCA